MSEASSGRSVKDAALISGNHVLDIDKGVLSAMHLEHLESLLNKIPQVLSLALRVVDLVAEVVVADLEQIHHRENLAIVGD